MIFNFTNLETILRTEELPSKVKLYGYSIEHKNKVFMITKLNG